VRVKSCEDIRWLAGSWREACTGMEDGPGLRAQWPAILMGEGRAVEPSGGLVKGVRVGELSLDDAVLMATMSLARHTC